MSAVSVCIIFLALIPNAKKINELQLNIAENQRQLEIRYIKSIYLKRSLEQYDQVVEMAKKYENMTMSKGQELQVIQDLETVAEKNNIRQMLKLSGDLSAEDSDIGLPYYTFKFRNHGSFANMVEYFKDLELLPYHIIIDSTQWQRGSEKYDAEVGVNFDGKIYVEK